MSKLCILMLIYLQGLQIAQAASGRQAHIVVLGDSLVAGFMISSELAFPAVLEKALRERGLPVVVTNAGVSGDTADDGLARLDRDVPNGTDGVILELGANDKLRHHSPSDTKRALIEIIRRLTSRNIAVLVVGIEFTDVDGLAFNRIFSDAAKCCRASYYPDIYYRLRSEDRFTIFDGVHPSAEGVKVMVENISPSAYAFVKRLLKERL